MLDINVQRDFLGADAVLPVANRQGALEGLRVVMHQVRLCRIPVVSCIDVSGPNHGSHAGPASHVDHSIARRKVSFSLMPRRLFVQADNSLGLPRNVLTRYRQVMFAKRGPDVLGNPKLERLFDELCCERVYVCGVALEQSVREVVLGLLVRQVRATLIADACGYFDLRQAKLALRQIEAKGAGISSAETFCREASALSRRPRPLLRAK